MALQRYNTGKSYVFDPGTRGTLEPQVMPSSLANTQVIVAPNSTMSTSTYNTKLAAFPAGTTPRSLCWVPPILAGPTTYYTYFGSPLSAEASEYMNSYGTNRPTAPLITKNINQSVYASFILRVPTITDTTQARAPVIGFGLSSFGMTASLPSAAASVPGYASWSNVGAHSTTGTGYLTMALVANNTGTGGTQVNGTVAGDAEYQCSFAMTAAGVATVTIGGMSASFTYTTPLGNFYICLGMSAVVTANLCGIRAMRIWVG